MKVYVLEGWIDGHGGQDDNVVLGVFSTPELAKEYFDIVEYNFSYYTAEGYEIDNPRT